MRTKILMALLAAAAVSGCNTTTTVSPSLKVTVVGKPLNIDTHYSTNPDCTSAGQPTVRIIEAPKHGKVELRETTDFPEFKANNSRAHCNMRRVPVVQITYIPAPGYSGPDSFKTDVVYASGTARLYDYKVDVR